MADIEATTTNESGFAAKSRVGNYELSIDATSEEGPTPNEVLVSDYAACYTFAFRAGAQREHDLDLGRIETEASADVDEDDDLEDGSVSFHLDVEADLDDEQIDDLIALGEEICHVHAALREELHADVEVTGKAF
jgi:uncharacterized OsmC-like protein